MKLVVKKEQLGGEAPENFLRHAGYGMIYDKRRGVTSFVRRLGNNFYPRLHMYCETLANGQVAFNLHLDQKQASYEGSHMHNAEYDGEVVGAEIERLRDLIGQVQPVTTSTTINNTDNRGGSYIEDAKNYQALKKRWWQKLLGI